MGPTRCRSPVSPASSLTSVSSVDSVSNVIQDNTFFSKPSKAAPATVVVKEYRTTTTSTSSMKSRSQPTPEYCTNKTATSSTEMKKKEKLPIMKNKRKKVDDTHQAVHNAVKRLKTPSEQMSRSSSRSSSRAPSPPPVYRASRSRSTSSFFQGFPEVTQQRDWCYRQPCSKEDLATSSHDVVLGLLKKYKTYFKNHEDPDDKSFELVLDADGKYRYPVAELEYPNRGASEKFILVAPKDKDHYNPIMCLESTLFTIIEFFLTPKQQKLFGDIPNPSLVDASSPPPSPSPSPPRRAQSTRSRVHADRDDDDDDDDDEEEEEEEAEGELSPDDDEYLDLCNLHPEKPGTNYLRGLQRGIHLQDGPLFMKSLKRINTLLQCLKYPRLKPEVFSEPPLTTFQRAAMNWASAEIPEKVLMRILEENYQRTVGPHVTALKQYQAFSSTVYGELMPSLSYEIIKRTGLTQDKLFLDLGSGVGNVVLQASLQTGCRSFGVELMPTPARVAANSATEFRKRCRMWGINLGDIELEEQDMLKSEKVAKLMSQADVVLVDNKVFEESLNEALRPKFLDLKEGAYVVSLVPFVSSVNARITQRNVDDMSAIFDVTEHPFHSGSVSWGNSGGTYYIHRVDRSGYADVRQRFEAQSGASTRSTRSRR